MELQTASQVSQNYGVSTRMLRYYEQIGLLESSRKDDYAYRVYDENALKRLQQIIILRKLQIPVKQISVILNNPNAATAIEIFKANISELQTEINALSTIKSALEIFVSKIEELAAVRLNLNLLTDESVAKLAESLSLIQKNVKEIKAMEELNKADKQLNKLNDKDVRIIYLPPATVASLHFVGNDKEGRIPEDQGGDIITAFVNKLAKIKPDCRHYGFNHSVDGKHGYERWFTIPDDMKVSAPFVKKQFPGGVYGAYALRTWDVEWDLLVEWANQHEKFDFAQGNLNMMLGLLEEHLNVMGQYALPDVKHDTQVDLLIPLREKREWPDALGYITDSESKCGYKASLIEKKGVTVAGYIYKPTKDAGCEVFYKKLADDGRLELMKKALKSDTPILVFHHYDSGYKINVCVDINDAAEKEYFKSDKMNVKKIPKKKWIQFELTMEDIKEHSFDKWNPHNLVGKLGYKFDGSAGFFFVYNCRELVTTEENKNELFYCWMPVRPLE